MSEEIPTVRIRDNASMAEAVIVIAMAFGFVVPWIMGVALAKGFWSTFFAIPFFPYAWYLTIERLMQMTGIIPQACL